MTLSSDVREQGLVANSPQMTQAAEQLAADSGAKLVAAEVDESGFS
ncbi:MAG: hypothetical protein ABR529_13525 [Actinomycetota bacterium]